MKKIKKISAKQKHLSELFKLFAEVDPSYLESFSKMLNKNLELSECKDTEDYNLSNYSNLVDRIAFQFMEAGQKDLALGEGLNVEARLKLHHGQNLEIKDFEDALVDGDYRKYPFSFNVEQEMRAKFLLQTQASDSFETLFNETLDLMASYISEDSLKLLKRAVIKARGRIQEENLLHLEPHKDFIKGNYRKLTDKELESYRLKSYYKELNEEDEVVEKPKDIYVDERKDSLDLLALKDLNLILKGNKPFEYFSIGPGFFAKVMPEVKDLGVDAIIFKVVDQELKEINLVRRKFKDSYKKEITFSPVESALLLTQEYALETEADPIYGDALTVVKSLKQDFIKDNERYYVVVDGCISSDDKKVVNYESQSLNEIKVPAGEVYLYEMREKVMATRMYFSPYKASLLHPMHQHGSVVFGHNDQSLHSCVKGDDLKLDDNTYDLAIKTLKRDYEAGDLELKEDLKFSPAMMATRFHFLEKDQEASILFNEDQYENVLRNLLDSVYETTQFSIYCQVYMLHHFGSVFKEDQFKSFIMTLLNDYQPLHKRFLLKEYVEEKRLSFEPMPTFWNELADQVGMKFMHEYLKSINEE